MRPLAPPGEAEAIAGNYVVYRKAVTTYASENPLFTGEASTSALALPEGHIQLRTWRHLIDASGVYVYGPFEPGVTAKIIERLDGTRHVGRSVAGQLVSPVYGAIDSLPAWCPNNQIVSMVRK